MSLVLLIVLLAIGLVLAMTLAWQIVLRTGNSGFTDVIWSYATGLAGVAAALTPIEGGELGPRNWLVAGLVAVWSIRLGTHILSRTHKGGDDPRYAALKAEWGETYRSQLFVFLQIQAGAGWVLAVAVLAAAHSALPIGLPDLLGVAVAIIAIVGEAIADGQLAAFRKDPANKGKVCDVGLWGLSRHPNYFFEWFYWLAYPVIALGSGFGWVALAAPLLMYWLLVHASGIPPLEAHMERSRPEAFAAYKRRVRAFWPIPKTPDAA